MATGTSFISLALEQKQVKSLKKTSNDNIVFDTLKLNNKYSMHGGDTDLSNAGMTPNQLKIASNEHCSN